MSNKIQKTVCVQLNSGVYYQMNNATTTNRSNTMTTTTTETILGEPESITLKDVESAIKDKMRKSEKFASEIEHKMSIEHDDGSTDDYVDAFFAMCDFTDVYTDWGSDGKPILKAIRDLEIKFGVYTPITDTEIAEKLVSYGSKYDFKRAGVKYAFNLQIEELLTTASKDNSFLPLV